MEIKGGFSLGLPKNSNQADEPSMLPRSSQSETATIETQVEENSRKEKATIAKMKTNAELHHENLLLQNAILKNQAVVLELFYYRLKLSKLQGPMMS